jgi:MFS family permease
VIGILGNFLKGRIESYCSTMLELLKVKAAITYLSIIRGARRFVIMVAVLVFCAVILACGFLLVPIALLLFMPWAPHTKAIVGIAIGAAYVLVPLILAAVLLSEKRWLRISRADELLRSVKQWKQWK